LQGAPDASVYDACWREQCCLVTLDLDFSNLLDFPPGISAGIVILRHPKPRLRCW
jgi:predicted nuclease of predicted toxin-antitoxin system